jgi:hypothetical protein
MKLLIMQFDSALHEVGRMLEQRDFLFSLLPSPPTAPNPGLTSVTIFIT